MSIVLIDRGRGVKSAFITRPVPGMTRRALGAVRLKRETDGFRIDRCDAIGGAWLPWEAIDAVHYASEADATMAILAWASAHGATAED